MKNLIFTLFLLSSLSFETSLLAQNVGIGEKDPASKLSVKGNMSIGPNYSKEEAPIGGIVVEGQVGIGTLNPDPSAVMDISSSSKGLLLPRLTHAQLMNIHNPTNGLIVYDIDSNYIFYFNNDGWVNLTILSEVNALIKKTVDSLVISYINRSSDDLNHLTGAGTPKTVFGATGPAGAAGSVWITGKGAPDLSTTGNINDLYLNTANGNYYQKTDALTWTLKGSLSGTTGPTGATGPEGPAGSSESSVMTRTGGTGNSGNSGTSGGSSTGTGTAGPIGPTGATGAAGIAGITGPSGVNGTNGTAWWTGASTPSVKLGNVNDLYLNTTNSNYYLKTDPTTWILQGNLLGANGATGPAGPAGLNGTNGAAGATGPTGVQGITGPTGPAASGPAGWSFSGNSISTGNFIGTTNSQPLIFQVNNSPAGYLGATDNNTFFGNQSSYTGGASNVGIGYKASVLGKVTNSIAIGNLSLVQPGNGSIGDIAIGDGANITGTGVYSYSMAIGSMAQAQAANDIIIGRAANANQQYSITIGDAAQSEVSSSTVIGQNAYTNASNAIAIGTSATSQAPSAISLGLNAYANGTNAIAIGSGSSANITQAQGSYSLALGYRANASQQDAIALGDHARAQGSNSIALGANVDVTNNNIVAIGNSGITSTLLNGATSTSYALMVGTNNTNGNGAYLTTGGTWTNASDKNLKEDFTTLNADDVLQKINQLDITRWKYKGTNEYHIGPMAQDFYALFNVGIDDKRISSIDPSGVALVAIKALSDKVDEQQKLIQKLSDELNVEKAHNKK